MEVHSISGFNSNSVKFEGKSKNKNNTPSVKMGHQNPTPHVPNNDEKASKAMRNLILGLMALGASTSSLTSCDPDPDNIFAIAEGNATANAIVNIELGDIKRDTTIIRDTIHDTDTIINTIIKPIYVKDYPFHIADSLIAQGINIGIPIDGPVPDGSGLDSVAYLGSKAHNRYDNKFYESTVDSVGTNKHELAVITKILDLYSQNNPKTSYMKTVISDVPGRGIKLTRYVTNAPKKPDDDEQYLWNYAGYEVRSNGRNGFRNTRSIFDNNNNLIFQGDYQRGENPGTFLYGTLIYDEETGEPILGEDGKPEFAQYDFDQAVVYSDYAKRKEDYKHDGWKYEN